MRWTRSIWWLVFLATALVGGCNLVTGSEYLQIDKKKNGGDDDGGAGSGATSNGGTGVTGGAGTGGQPPPPPGNQVAADGVFIDQISLYQGVKRRLMENGAPQSSNVPIVAGREALMRLFVSTDGAYNGQPVFARLWLGDQQPIEFVTPIPGGSTDSQLDSTINFSIPGAALPSTLSYRVELLQSDEISSGSNAGAVFPYEGQELMPIESTGPQLKIVLIPIRYDADGSNRMPDTSESQLNDYRDKFYSIYPTSSLELIVKPAVTWNNTVAAYGSGWGELLQAMIDYRQQSGAGNDEYYYGIFSPASSFAQYCSNGCVAGLSVLAGPNDSFARVGIGLGFPGHYSIDTAIHEVGHEHGREHAPCGVNDDVDWSYPHSGGKIGVWGYDVLEGKLYNPATVVDFMSYCDPIWVSDYTYIALFNRIKYVNNADFYVADELKDRSYERITIGMDGEANWLAPLQLPHPPTGEKTALWVKIGTQLTKVEGWYYPYSHLSGGMLLFPQLVQPATGVLFEFAGMQHELTR